VKSRGAGFITAPIPKYGEGGCYISGPGGYVIQVAFFFLPVMTSVMTESYAPFRDDDVFRKEHICLFMDLQKQGRYRDVPPGQEPAAR